MEKGYIALCAHFHQPHFQLPKVREQVYRNSYLHWIGLLENCVKRDGFYINIHFSGPFLYWIGREKEEMRSRLYSVCASGRVGVIGGLADEAFVQLSTRRDDVLFQLGEYAKLSREMLGAEPRQWQAIHIPERECGEYLLDGLNRAASALGASPLYYFDSETYYGEHYGVPGGSYDFCRELFGFDDCVAQTTFPRLPEELLYFCFRDELAGERFFGIPVHRQFRYRFLKTTPFRAGDSTGVSPAEYFAQVKETLRRARELSEAFGRPLAPIVTIFEDAEKFGDWSKDPQRDTAWLSEFLRLAESDPETELIGLKEYAERVGYLDTYPISSSRSYAEWENWTAKRGVRGITFGDERLRRSVARLHLLEEDQRAAEERAVSLLIPSPEVGRSVLCSDRRFAAVRDCLDGAGADGDVYYTVNRIRNLAYQEDPKWACRHPNYGSSPYFDGTGFAYVELAHRALDLLNGRLGLPSVLRSRMCDWDGDGEEEALILTDRLTVSADPRGGCIDYLFVLSERAKGAAACGRIAAEEAAQPGRDTSVWRYAYPMVMSETDSELTVRYGEEGARSERCRNAFRCSLVQRTEDGYRRVCDAESRRYALELAEDGSVVCKTEGTMYGGGRFSVGKRFSFHGGRIEIEMSVTAEGDGLYLVPEIVATATASDGRRLCPRARLGFRGEKHASVHIARADRSEHVFSAPCSEFFYGSTVEPAEGDKFENGIGYFLSSEQEIDEVYVRPAVEFFYRGFVHDGQSRLGYDSSGIAILPHVKLCGGKAAVRIVCDGYADGAQYEDCIFTELLKDA